MVRRGRAWSRTLISSWQQRDSYTRSSTDWARTEGDGTSVASSVLPTIAFEPMQLRTSLDGCRASSNQVRGVHLPHACGNFACDHLKGLDEAPTSLLQAHLRRILCRIAVSVPEGADDNGEWKGHIPCHLASHLLPLLRRCAATLLNARDSLGAVG